MTRQQKELGLVSVQTPSIFLIWFPWLSGAWIIGSARLGNGIKVASSISFKSLYREKTARRR